MLVGILACEHLDELGRYGFQDYFFRECIRLCEPHGIQMFVFTPSSVLPGRTSIGGYELVQDHWQKRSFTVPDVIYDRGFFHTWPERVAARLTHRQLSNIFYINPVPLIDLASDKWQSFKFMVRNGFNTPLTIKPDSVDDIMDFIKQRDCAFLKPDWGLKGRDLLAIIKKFPGTYLLECNDHTEQVAESDIKTRIDAVLQKRSRGIRDFVIQEFVQTQRYHDSTFDFRVLVQKNENMQWQVTGAAARSSPPGSYISNIRQGGQVQTVANVLKQIGGVPVELQREMTALSIKLCQALEDYIGQFGELGLDLLLDTRGNLWIVEFNSKPGRMIFTYLADRADLAEDQRQYYRQIRQRAVITPFLYARRCREVKGW